MLHVVIFLAGIVSGLTSFGFALVAVPLLTFLVGPKTAITISLLLANVSRIFLIIETWKWMNIKKLMPLISAGIIGTFIGSYFLFLADNIEIKILIGLVTIISSLMLLTGFKKPLKNEKNGYIPIGLISGFLNGSTGIGGPPVVIFQSNQSIGKNIFRANNTLFFTVLTFSSLFAQIVGKVVTKEILLLTLTLIPTLIIGTIVGFFLSKRINDNVFRNLTLILILFTGFSVIIPLFF